MAPTAIKRDPKDQLHEEHALKIRQMYLELASVIVELVDKLLTLRQQVQTEIGRRETIVKPTGLANNGGDLKAQT